MPPFDVFYPCQRTSERIPGTGRTNPFATDEDEYTLSGYGDISLDNALFVPGLPSSVLPKDHITRTPPPRLVGNTVVRNECPVESASPSAEFTSLPNYEAIVARLKRLRDHIQGQESGSVTSSNSDETQDADEISPPAKDETGEKAKGSSWLSWSNRKGTGRKGTHDSHQAVQLRTSRPARPRHYRTCSLDVYETNRYASESMSSMSWLRLK